MKADLMRHFQMDTWLEYTEPDVHASIAHLVWLSLAAFAAEEQGTNFVQTGALHTHTDCVKLHDHQQVYLMCLFQLHLLQLLLLQVVTVHCVPHLLLLPYLVFVMHNELPHVHV